jgi:hypothetical protein
MYHVCSIDILCILWQLNITVSSQKGGSVNDIGMVHDV